LKIPLLLSSLNSEPTQSINNVNGEGMFDGLRIIAKAIEQSQHLSPEEIAKLPHRTNTVTIPLATSQLAENASRGKDLLDEKLNKYIMKTITKTFVKKASRRERTNHIR
jgi:hypothetical protein